MSTKRRRRRNSESNDLIESTSPTGQDEHEKSDLRGDKRNIAVLLFLYILQGIPIGLIAAVPMLLQNRGASYKQQAEFSFAYWPFSIKLLWAPIVDSLYVRRFGRRKSWLVPVQYLLGGFMLLLSAHVDRWLGGDGVEPNVPMLTLLFFVLNFLAATQDIAVDGWALTMLKRCNVGYASTCNSVGQTAGYFLGYVVFIILESKDICNWYLRDVPSDEGMVTLPRFLYFWGITFIVATTLVAIFKKENDVEDAHTDARYKEEHELNIHESYKVLWDIVRKRPVQILAAILLTVKVTFAASDAVTSLKLIDAGVPKEKLALLAMPLIPLQIILPLFVGKYTNGPRPMDLYLRAIPWRIVLATVATFIAYATPYLISGGEVPFYYYVLLVTSYGCYQVFLYSMFVAAMAFFAKISDPAVGGTYMTFLNTLCNLGGNWPNTVVLWLVDVLTFKQCSTQSTNLCLNKEELQECTKSGGKCEITFDGYYLEAAFCVVYGIIWLLVVRKWIRYLQDLPKRDWSVVAPIAKKQR
ncbi:acetyl-coenzyme A transporter 1 [Drosophila sulfurigaster albostrigata]|uniref:acetyl-coenzyme A transporter 1 n=1 Tax=Drosophila sulfurigaster albostrigata TaxID=89887 RepID=UPI002D21CC7F|nr:acetyl-coenzyme A transporter 1 [Drosophila sulfurigaster albostrigata]